MIDVLAIEPQFAEHARPVWQALPPFLRGEFGPSVTSTNPVLVSSHGDLRVARALGRTEIAYLEHGAGQSYGGDPGSARHRSYAGGEDHEDVSLFLVPGPHPAARWREAYPAARVEMVGSPRLDSLPGREGDAAPVVALSFHFNAMAGCQESNGLWRWYRHLIPTLAKRFDLIGHAHPRWSDRIRPWFQRAGVPFVDRFEDVCRRASVYVCDNSSTIFEFASTGRPVVLLNAPEYRRSVDHGLRFWSASHVGVNAKPKDVVERIVEALEDAPERQVNREQALSLVYGHRSGGAGRAAAALVDWLAERRAVAA